MERHEVVIVGAGPAGLFAALELAEAGREVLLLEKGKDLDRRLCPIRSKGGVCPPCYPCNMVSGLGGAGAFSDGKLTLSPQVGGRLPEYLGTEKTQELIKYVDAQFVRFGADNHVWGLGPEVEALRHRASMAELLLTPVPIRHLGTERCQQILQAIKEHLSGKVEIRLGVAAEHILVEDGCAAGVRTENGEKLASQCLIVAPGREGADWLHKEAGRLKLTRHHNPVDLGLRVEVPGVVLEELTRVLYESKMEYFTRTFDDRIRTFCMCPWGEVTMESTGGADPVTTVNGHSYADHRTENTNFALLVSTTFTEPFRDPIAYGKYVARLANLLSGGVLVQRLGDLREGRRSTSARMERGIVQPTLKSAIPGDLSCVLPYRFLRGILEMLEAMDQMAPGVNSRHTLLYGVEVKFYSSRLELRPTMETEVRNLFACGDGAGVSRGLVQASASGVLASRAVQERLRERATTRA